MSSLEVYKKVNNKCFQVNIKDFKGEAFYEVLEKIKSIKGRKYISSLKRWEFPLCMFKEFCKLFENTTINEINEVVTILVKPTHIQILIDENSEEFKSFSSSISGKFYLIDFCFFVDILQILNERCIDIKYEFDASN